MFLTKMVKDFMTNINSHQQQPEKPHQTLSRSVSSNCRSCKKAGKSKKSEARNNYNVYENSQLPEPPKRKGSNFNGQHKANSKTIAPTKVKSASWKRSDKSIPPFNPLANKKHKILRKKSPNWLKFSISKTKKSDPNEPFDGSESTSACRPGTLYSDVLFGAGCSNLAKIKNCITPRLHNSTAANLSQKQLAKALFKFNGKPDNEAFEDSKVHGKKSLFPALKTIKNKIFLNSKNDDKNFLELTKVMEENPSNKQLLNTSTTFRIEHDKTDAPTLPVLEGLTIDENKTSKISYLQQHIQKFNDSLDPTYEPSSHENQFLFTSISNIPKWNFISVETGVSDAFPKFLYQFDDENYLKAEKMALLGLKLALGNNGTK